MLPFDKMPYTNFHELNLAYFIVHFREIFAEWETLYNNMVSWREQTDADLTLWKTDTLNAIEDYERDLTDAWDTWKAETALDITDWKNETLDALDAWKTAFQTLFNSTFSNLSQIKTDAEAARDAAIAAQNRAEDAASRVAASVEQINENTEDIIELRAQIKNNANWPIITWVDGKFISRQGGIATDENYAYCEISLSGMKKIRFTLNSTNGNLSYVTKTDSFINVDYGHIHTPTVEWIEHTVEDTEAYIRISSDMSLKNDFFFYYIPDYDATDYQSLKKSVAALGKNINELSEDVYLDIKASDIFWSAGRYNPSNGAEYASPAVFRLTINGIVQNYITFTLRSDVLPNDIVYIKSKTENDYFYISAWDESGTYIGIYDIDTNTFMTSYSDNRITSVYQNVRFSDIKNQYPSYIWKITVGDITNSTTALDPASINAHICFRVPTIDYLNYKMTITKDGGYCRIFKKFGCIGDSLASGAFEYKDAGVDKIDFINEFSWPQYMARICDNSAINFSAGGLTTRTWIASDYCTQLLSGGDYLCDCYIIGLGVNDMKTDNRYVPVGTIEDINILDYTQNADTYYGNYGGIIQRIKSVQPRAKIFVLTNPGRTQIERAAAIPYNTALSAICDLFTNCYLVNLYSLGMFDSRYRLGSHYGSNGYLKAAWDISSMISGIIENRPSEFKEVAFIGTNKTWEG